MKLIKAKFSRFPEWDDEFMSTQREYTFRTELDLKLDMVVFGQKYHKYLHITDVIDDDKLFYSAKEDNFSDEKHNDSYFSLAIIEETGEFMDLYPIVRT